MENERQAACPHALEQALTRPARRRGTLSAAWQLHVERIEEQLHSGWRIMSAKSRGALRGTLGRLATNSTVLAERAAAWQATRSGRTSRGVRGAKPFVRRLGQAQASANGPAALPGCRLDYCRRCLFQRRPALGIAEGAPADEAAMADCSARNPVAGPRRLFAAAMETRDVVIAQRHRGRFLPGLAAWVGEAEQERVHPTDPGARPCAALLYAEPSTTECAHSALDLLSWPRAFSLGARRRDRFNRIGGDRGSARAANLRLPDWHGCLRPSGLHQRAQRFRAVTGAEMRLYQSRRCVSDGRTNRTRPEKADRPRRARRSRRQFLADCASDVGLLHQELVRRWPTARVRPGGRPIPGPLV